MLISVIKVVDSKWIWQQYNFLTTEVECATLNKYLGFVVRVWFVAQLTGLASALVDFPRMPFIIR
jgi:hypothetical protein